MVVNFQVRTLITILFCCGSFFGQPGKASADVIFEGYYKIKLGSTHAGYAIQRYEFDSKKSRFKSTYFIQTNKILGNLQESVVAFATDKFKPIKYQYTTKVGEAFKTVDATFDKQMMMAKVSNGKDVNPISRQVPEGTFLSTFLGYVMLQNGYQIEKKYSYKAVAEEDAKAYEGSALIKEETKYKGESVYRILNDFKNSRFVSLVSKKGEVLSTASPVQKISTELVKQPVEATKGFQLPQQSLKILFGGVPIGKKNLFHPVEQPNKPKPLASTAKKADNKKKKSSK